MTSRTMQCVYLFLIFILIFCQNNFGCCLQVETVPRSFTAFANDELNVTCVPDDPAYWARDIVAMEMMKKGQKPLVILRRGEIVRGPSIKPNMEFAGQIDRDARQSFLRLTIRKPGIGDAGTYVCVIYYLTEEYKMKEERSSANVSVDNDNHIVIGLLKKLSKLDKRVGEQGDEISEIDDRLEALVNNTLGKRDQKTGTAIQTLYEMMEGLHNRIEINTANITKGNTQFQQQEEKIQRLLDNQGKQLQKQVSTTSIMTKQNQRNVREQGIKIEQQEILLQNRTTTMFLVRNKMDEQSKLQQEQNDKFIEFEKRMQAQELKLDQQGRLLQKQADIIADLKSQITAQNKQIQEQQQHKMDEVAKDSFTTAFSASYNPKDTVTVGNTVIFRDLIFTLGKDYNPSTGVFTAPKPGLYVFHLTALVNSKDGWIYIDLVVNDKPVVTLQSHDYNYWDQSAISTVVSLDAGDKVSPKVSLLKGVKALYDADHFSVFNGYLLKLF